MESVLRGIAIDPGIRDLLAFCERRGYPFAITSEGLDWYVNTILEHHGIHGVRLYTSHISFDNGTFRFDFPWYDDETPSRGVCKPKILRESQSLGMKTVYIGDGISDFEAAKVAEAVYATRRLLEYCRARGIPAIPFQSLSDVVVNWKEL
jgi:2-hydroxy-3-keto-5-methylthiopentenyl-1-phosphate phosphatase